MKMIEEEKSENKNLKKQKTNKLQKPNYKENKLSILYFVIWFLFVFLSFCVFVLLKENLFTKINYTVYYI